MESENKNINKNKQKKILGSLARKAIPLYAPGVKLAAPHVKGIAKDVTHRVANEATNKRFNKPKPKRKRVSKRKNEKTFTSKKEIFSS